MQRVVDISLAGHPAPFRLQQDAFDRLSTYLEGAQARLTDEADRAEVLDDLERSIGEKLAGRVTATHPVLTASDVADVLAEVGTVDVESPASSTAPPRPATGPEPRPTRRRLYRIREGQQWAGVCTGLAAYAEINVNAVRWIFVLLGILTAGVFLLVYLVATFVMPVVATRREYIAAMAAPAP